MNGGLSSLGVHMPLDGPDSEECYGFYRVHVSTGGGMVGVEEGNISVEK